jgi:uncharacterized protein (DUF427 family)
MEYFTESAKITNCITFFNPLGFFKGKAMHYDIKVNDTVAPAAAWYYPTPNEIAKNLKVCETLGVDTVGPCCFLQERRN